MARKAFRLEMTSPLHVGERGVGLEETMVYIPSDTLFSALVVTWLEVGHDIAAIKAAFQSQPALLVTSAFPFAGDVLLLPKPHLSITPGTESARSYKRAHWVSASIFARLVAGITQDQLAELWLETQSRCIQRGAVWLTLEEFEQIPQHGYKTDDGDYLLWDTQRVPKVTVDRLQNASTLFHVGRVHYHQGCGLWFMADGEELWLQRLEAALRVLGDSGMGGQRSRGHGQFALKGAMIPNVNAAPGMSAYRVLLSRLAPTAGEMSLLRQPQSNYQLVTVGGWTGMPGEVGTIRRQVRMLVEGSVIGRSNVAPGALVDITPEEFNPAGHPIYRYGYGFTAPIQLAA